MIVSKKFIPSLFTILNAFCGFLSIIESSNNNFEAAALFIFYGGVFDLFDGIVARLLKTSSDFGVELDSLSDVVTFGAAPSFLLYQIYFKNLDGAGIFISSLILAFSAIRLARFNVELTGYDKEKFKGIPTPVSSLTICSYILFYHNKILDNHLSAGVISILAVFLPIMMVSKFKYFALPKLSLTSFKKHSLIFSSIILAVIISVLSKGVLVFPIFMLYIISGIFYTLWEMIKRKQIKN